MKDKINKLRNNTIGTDVLINTCYGQKKMIYADWTASGRLYAPIENFITNIVGPYVGNTHTECSEVGRTTTELYNMAKENIKRLVNANENDIIIPAGNGMTGAINKLQSIMGLKNKNIINYKFTSEERPIVFITQYEHNSNYISWVACNCDVVILNSDEETIVSFDDLEEKLIFYKNRKIKIGSFCAASNVSGTIVPFKTLAKIMHRHNGLCFIDFAASAPYKKIDMHPNRYDEKLDAIFIAPHKFLGGPGSSGILIFDSNLYLNPTPDIVGGGIIDYVSPWQEISYLKDISLREDAGTPGFLQTIKASLCMDLKEKIIEYGLIEYEDAILKKLANNISSINGIDVVEKHISNKIGIVSFYTNRMHYNLIGKMLNDRFGIQTRCGCLCASILAHNTLNISKEKSNEIFNFVKMNNYSLRPGFVRISIHPTTTEEEIDFILYAVNEIVKHYNRWSNEYIYINSTSEFKNINDKNHGQVSLSDFIEI